MDSAMDCGQYVGLNVGGKIYRTSRATLTRYPDNFFATMLDSGIPSAKDEQGNYLIDRDGKIFRHILNFLRSGVLRLPDGFKEFDLLESEADFFSIKELQSAIEKTETIGVVDASGSIAYKMSRQSLMREKDSYFAKIVSGQINPLKDSFGNFVVDTRGSQAEFMQIMQYLKHGVILTAITPALNHEKSTLYIMAERFGLQVLKDQIMTSMNTPVPLSVYYWEKIHDCCLYCLELMTVSGRYDIYQDYAHIYKHDNTVTCTLAGLVDLKKILQDAPVTLKGVASYFRTSLAGQFRTCQPDVLSTDCIKLTFK